MSEVIPFVSICCTTYNHENYIKDTIEGFLMQKTDFPFEIIIHDDASTDNTAKIVEEYVLQYPNLIFPIYQEINQYSQGTKPYPNFVYPAARGKYIALCEGDDYWIDPLKLQKQVDFLEENSDCAMVFSNAEVIIENDGEKSNITRGVSGFKKSRYFSDIEIFENWIVPTASVIFRSQFMDEKYFRIATNKNFMFGDNVLFLHLASKGNVFGLKDTMVAYRRHIGGATNISIDISYYKKDYTHTIEVIKIFGNHLKSKKIKNKLADYTLSFAMNNFFNKKPINGIKYMLKSVQYNPIYLTKYIQSKLNLKNQ